MNALTSCLPSARCRPWPPSTPPPSTRTGPGADGPVGVTGEEDKRVCAALCGDLLVLSEGVGVMAGTGTSRQNSVVASRPVKLLFSSSTMNAAGASPDALNGRPLRRAERR